MNSTDIIVEPGRQDIVITRIFDASPQTVFEAITNPALIPAWWGPKEFDTRVDHMTPQHGGRWRFVHVDPEGNEYAFRGVYHDVITPERVVQTFEFEGAPGHVALETLTLEDLGGRTRFVTQQLHPSIEARDAMVASGMEAGVRDTYDRLAEVLRGL